jgi:hypothetical protein
MAQGGGEMKYGLEIPDSVIYGYIGQFEFVRKYHWIVENYLDTHPEMVPLLTDKNGDCRYYEILRKVLTTDEWNEFMKPQPWEIK